MLSELFYPYELEESINHFGSVRIILFESFFMEIDVSFKQTVLTLMGRRMMWRLIWVCTVCLYPIYGMLGINGLRDNPLRVVLID